MKVTTCLGGLNPWINLYGSEIRPIFWGLKDFSGVLFEALGNFFGFDFCSRSIIPVTRNPEYPPLATMHAWELFLCQHPLLSTQSMVSTSFILTLCSQIIFSKFTFSTQKTNSQSRFKTSLSSDQQRWKIPASSVRRKEKEGEKNGTAGTDWYLFSIKRACV